VHQDAAARSRGGEATAGAGAPAGNVLANRGTIEFFRDTSCTSVAEIGVDRGATSEELCKLLAERPGASIHLFDYADLLDAVAERLTAQGLSSFVLHPNSRRTLDSYNWSLMRLVEQADEPIFDYVYIDGAHTWAHDALAFLLVDRLLQPGGYVDFDDYNWSIATSATAKPERNPAILEAYTEEQVEARQVKMVVDLLVRRDSRYQEIVRNKIFRKLS
jgi:hypothetical protein